MGESLLLPPLLFHSAHSLIHIWVTNIRRKIPPLACLHIIWDSTIYYILFSLSLPSTVFPLPILKFDCSGRPSDLLPSLVSPPPLIPAVFHKEERSRKEEMGRSRRGFLLLTHLCLSFKWPAQVSNIDPKPPTMR